MFSPPNILLIKKFDFDRDGSELRDKYMIVLLQTDSDAIIAPLTTSKDKVPPEHEGKRCVIIDVDGLRFYWFPKGLKVCKNGFSFPLHTYVHVQGNLTTRTVSYLKQRYVDIGAVELKGKLTDAEYSSLLYCIYKSKYTKRGIKDAMEPIIEKLEQDRIASGN